MNSFLRLKYLLTQQRLCLSLSLHPSPPRTVLGRVRACACGCICLFEPPNTSGELALLGGAVIAPRLPRPIVFCAEKSKLPHVGQTPSCNCLKKGTHKAKRKIK